MRYLITITMGTEFDRYNVRLDAIAVAFGLDDIRAKLARIAGGYTEHITSGGWDNAGQVVTEQGRKFEVLTGELDSLMAVDKLGRELASFAAQALNQSSVMMTFTPVTAAFVGPNEA